MNSPLRGHAHATLPAGQAFDLDLRADAFAHFGHVRNHPDLAPLRLQAVERRHGDGERVGVEAAVRFGWDRWLDGERGDRRKSGFVGMEGFGASGPIEALYPHFGITAEAVAAKARSLL